MNSVVPGIGWKWIGVVQLNKCCSFGLGTYLSGLALFQGRGMTIPRAEHRNIVWPEPTEWTEVKLLSRHFGFVLDRGMFP